MENPITPYGKKSYSNLQSGKHLDNFWIIQQLLTTLYNSQLIHTISGSYQHAFHTVDNFMVKTK